MGIATRWGAQVGMFIVLGASGCGLPTLRAGITGIGAESSAPGKFAVGAFEAVSIDGDPFKLSLQSYQRIETTRIVRVKVSELSQGKNFNYQVLMGSPFGTNAVAEGWLEHSDPIFRVNTDGWVFAWGIWPFVRERWVTAGATGSTIAIEVLDADLQKTRVYFLEKTSPDSVVKITCLGKPTLKYELKDEGTYVEIARCVDDPVDALGNWILTPAPITNPMVTDFVAKVQNAGLAGGWAP